MNAAPLKKEIYDKAKALEIDTIILNFSGGSDEGYLEVELEPNHDCDFANEIEEWAWSVYSYSGAGDGSDYGDTIKYDLENNEVTTSEYYMVREDNENDPEELEIAE
ncbi:MAG: hypothetical protein EBR50_07575 [Proteobacteria bacterium]|nr:hypothetical protein [Pseudomonadota bacterium]